MPAPQPPFINLELVELVDSWPYFTKDPEAYKQHMQDYHYFLIDGYNKRFRYIHNSFANDLFPLYSSTREHALDMNGCGVDMLGIVNYSIHMICWVMTVEGMKLWVPHRALTKMSFPGKLDNTVGGSLASGESPIDGIVRECEEELCLEPSYVRANIRPCGINSFQLPVTDLVEVGCQHQDIVPRIGDGEVGEVQLITIDEVQQAMREGQFKLTCNLTYITFLIRHGYINAEKEPSLVELSSRLNRYYTLFVA
ncbi:NUDIX hydrolase domain-like protein [Xylariaceae sp. AK1471]|nr:NUDIX hydrolase domain-like protein [Xylariaceae sp. AK1471]